MKATIKNVSEFFKATKGNESSWSVIAFDPETKKRVSAYGGFEMMHALIEMTSQGAHGNICILTDKAGWDFMSHTEIVERRRVTFEEMKPYRVIVTTDYGRNEYAKSSGAFIK